MPPYIELVNRGRPTRVYVLHMALFVGLLVLGWAAVELRGRDVGAAPCVGDRPAAGWRSWCGAAPCRPIAG